MASHIYLKMSAGVVAIGLLVGGIGISSSQSGDKSGVTVTPAPASAQNSVAEEFDAALGSSAPYRIIGVGDIMMGSDYPSPRMDPKIKPGADPADVMGQEMKDLFKSGDVVFGNFEGTLYTSSAGAKYCRNPAVCYVFRSPPFHAKYLKDAGFTMMSNANNHARDFGEGGRSATFKHLREAGFAVPAIRFPTVPRNTARLRITLSSVHTPEEITRLKELLA